MVIGDEDMPLSWTAAAQVVGGQSTSYHVVPNGSLFSANGLVSWHAGQSKVIMVVLQVDEAIQPGHSHQRVLAAGMV